MARETKQRSRRSRSGAGLGRALSVLAFLPIASRVPMYTRLVTALVMDDRMPMNRKALLAGAAGYLVLGRDLIPDDTPIIGGLDDLVVVVLAVELFLDGVPSDLLDEKLAEQVPSQWSGRHSLAEALYHQLRQRLASPASDSPAPGSEPPR